MKTYVLLFRGINVGGRNILPMKELVSLLEENLYKNIKTYIQSGNVVLQSPKKPDDNIRLEIQRKFGFKPNLIVLGKTDIDSAVSNNPYHSREGKTVHFFFCKRSPSIDLEKLNGLKADSEEYFIKDKVLYFYAPEGVGRSKFAAKIESCLGVPATGRNLNTVNKLQEMVRASSR